MLPEPYEPVTSDVALWRDALIELSALENVRPEHGLLQQIDLGPVELGVTLTTGQQLMVRATASRQEMASAISGMLGETVVANATPEWAPPFKTENL